MKSQIKIFVGATGLFFLSALTALSNCPGPGCPSGSVNVSASALSEAQVTRLVQAALNFFGFDAGPEDGVLGRRSGIAVSKFQTHMGYTPSGDLQLGERDFLLTSYFRARFGGTSVTQSVASTAPRRLLHLYRDQSLSVQNATPVAVASLAPPTTTTVVAATPQPTTGASALPSFSAPRGETIALSSYCNTVSLQTNLNGGFATLATMGDPSVVFGEQFCLARVYSIAQGEEIKSRISGFTSTQIDQQCVSLGIALKDVLAKLSIQPPNQVVRATIDFVQATGMPNQQLQNTAEVCLASGYKTDRLEVAIGSALVLVALSEDAYGELVGYHLLQGFGVAKNENLGLLWLETSLGAFSNGETAIFAPGNPQRIDLLEKAVDAARGLTSNERPIPVIVSPD